jgi:hypothetical protein
MSKRTFLQIGKKIFKISVQFLHLDHHPDPATQINADPCDLDPKFWWRWRKCTGRREEKDEGNGGKRGKGKKVMSVDNAKETEEKGTGE